MLRLLAIVAVATSLAACYQPKSAQDAAVADASVVDTRAVDTALPDAPPDAAAAIERACTDGFDDDLDGNPDCADVDCAAAVFCTCRTVELPLNPGSGAADDSFGILDTPGNNDEILSNTVLLYGWALDTAGIANVTLRIDTTREVVLTYGAVRNDVCAAYPGYVGCDNVGWNIMFNVRSLSRCQHLFEIVATDSVGNVRIIARRRVVVD